MTKTILTGYSLGAGTQEHEADFEDDKREQNAYNATRRKLGQHTEFKNSLN
jgi:hypothetical protein